MSAVRGPAPMRVVSVSDSGPGIDSERLEFQRHGVFRTLGTAEPEPVRVPSLRNVTATAPYFHDGGAATLNEAVRQMGLAQLDHLLTDPQVDSIIAFLETLTGLYQVRLVMPAGARPSVDKVPQ